MFEAHSDPIMESPEKEWDVGGVDELVCPHDESNKHTRLLWMSKNMAVPEPKDWVVEI